MGIPDPIRDPQFYQGVPLRRFVAFWIDFLIILALFVPVLIIGAAVTVLTFGLAAPFLMLFFTVTGFVYRWGMLKTRSATLGMSLTGIEVRDRNGNTCDSQLAFMHTVGFFVTFLAPPLLIVGWLMMANSPHRRAMHDLFVGSVVINRPT